MSDPFFAEPLSPEEERRILGRDLEGSKGFSLNFVLTNQAPARAKHIAALREEHPALNLVEIHLSEPVRSFINLLRSQKTEPLPTAYLIYGIEEWVSSKEDGNQIPFFRNLNAARNSFLKEFSCAFVFWIPEWLLGKFLEGCPDFVSIRNGIYQFLEGFNPANLVLVEKILTPKLDNVYQMPEQERFERAQELEKIMSSLRALNRKDIDSNNYIQIANSLIAIYFVTAQYDKAESILFELLGYYELELGDEKEDISEILNNIGVLFKNKGEYDKSEFFFKNAISMKESIYREDNESIAICVDNLADLYTSKGLYEEAEVQYERARNIFKKIYGENHPDVAIGLDNLALLYHLKGEFEHSERLFIRSLEIFRKTLGERHPDTATGLSNLAGLYQSVGRYSDAESLFLQALSVYEDVLGVYHPSVAACLNNLALLYKQTGRMIEAEVTYKRSLEIRILVYGEEHVETAIVLNNLGVLYCENDKKVDAVKFLDKSFDIQYSKLGRHHAYTQKTLVSLVSVLLDLEENERVLQLMPLIDQSM